MHKEELQPQSLTVDEFCRVNRICRATFYRIVKDGRGPRLMKVGTRTLVSVEAAAEWRRAMEAPHEGARCPRN
jgi:predicted DNA-binding transcriptional regulator AlpA